MSNAAAEPAGQNVQIAAGAFDVLTGPVGSGGLCLILVLLIYRLNKSTKFNPKPSLIVSLGILAGASFLQAGGLWKDVNAAVTDLIPVANEMGLGEVNAGALGIIVAICLAIGEKLTLMQRVILGFVFFVIWSNIDGSIGQSVTKIFVKLAEMFR